VRGDVVELNVSPCSLLGGAGREHKASPNNQACRHNADTPSS
jgi:hypothetical protein